MAIIAGMNAEPLRPGDPRTVGPYGLAARLGRGPQGVVYLGRRPGGGQVAVKVLHARFGGNSRARARFMHELAAAQQVDDPGVARILGAGLHDGAPYIASEFVQGPPLRWVVEIAGPRTGEPLERMAIGVAGALWALHRAGVIHRDLSPGNVLLDSSGPRVIDFGYGPALQAGGVRGTAGGPAFRAPEQLGGAGSGSAADVFAWACLVVFAASGKSPFGEGPAMVHRILNSQPDLGSLDGRLRSLVRDCLAKEPRERPSAQQLLLELTGTTHPSVRSWPSLEVVREPQPPQQSFHPYLGISGVQPPVRRPLLVAASVLVPLLVGAGAVHWGSQASHELVVDQVSDSTVELKPYRIRALRGGVDGGLAFADYELTNTRKQSVRLEMPAELLLQRSKLPDEVSEQCTGAALCTLPSRTEVVSRLSGSPAPELRKGDLYMAPKGSYVLRVTTTIPVGATLEQADLSLVVSDARFVRTTVPLKFATPAG